MLVTSQLTDESFNLHINICMIPNTCAQLARFLAPPEQQGVGQHLPAWQNYKQVVNTTFLSAVTLITVCKQLSSYELLKLYAMLCAVSCVLEYVTELMDLLFNEAIHDPAPFVAELKAVAVPGFLCSQYERAQKADAIASHVSRFNCPFQQSKLKHTYKHIFF